MSAAPASAFGSSGSVRERVHQLLVPTDDPGWKDAVRALDPGEALPVVAEALAGAAEDDSRTRHLAVLMIGVIGDERGVPVLEGVADHPDPVLRARVVEALAGIGRLGPGASRRVVDASRDEDAYVRETAARAVAALDLPEAGALLAEMAASDPAPEVRRAAEEAARSLQGGGG